MLLSLFGQEDWCKGLVFSRFRHLMLLCNNYNTALINEINQGPCYVNKVIMAFQYSQNPYQRFMKSKYFFFDTFSSLQFWKQIGMTSSAWPKATHPSLQDLSCSVSLHSPISPVHSLRILVVNVGQPNLTLG